MIKYKETAYAIMPPWGFDEDYTIKKSMSNSEEKAWEKFCYPSLRRYAYECEGFKPVQIDLSLNLNEDPLTVAALVMLEELKRSITELDEFIKLLENALPTNTEQIKEIEYSVSAITKVKRFRLSLIAKAEGKEVPND